MIFHNYVGLSKTFVDIVWRAVKLYVFMYCLTVMESVLISIQRLSPEVSNRVNCWFPRNQLVLPQYMYFSSCIGLVFVMEIVFS